ncbi:MAG: Na(+)-translocating NADH-quinone reductase subunit B [Chlamydiae bacterium]|nr:Na(+)-translocating NADH-quinone reductase subunit B [Chlamydiota bacterium]
MLRKFLDYQLSLTEKGKPLHRLKPLITAGDTFLYESPSVTKQGPHIRDIIDLKRWMIIVVIALIPCILMAIWNTGLQSFIYSSGDFRLMDEFNTSTYSLSEYFAFAAKDYRWWTIIKEGLAILLPIVLISYLVGGFWEVVFACVRDHEVSEGFLVTGILYALILPPTIPYWMVAVGVSVGIIFSKELFGGVGMNIVNPALACRTFLFFSYPGKMSGNVWVGSNPAVVRNSLLNMTKSSGTGALDGYTHASPIDGYTQATQLAQFNVPMDIKRIHVDAIATNDMGDNVGTIETIKTFFSKWNTLGEHQATLGDLTQEQMRNFVSSPLPEGGLGLSSGYYEEAHHFADLNYGIGYHGDWTNFLGNKLGSLGETSTLACLLGAIFLIYTGVGSWRSMLAMGLGAYLCALFFQMGATFFGADAGAWTSAQFGFPPYKHFLLGGLAFGLVFMITDPVSSPAMNSAKWIYGIFCGVITIVIRAINPAFPEGVMLAILMGNVFAPLFDYYSAQHYRNRRARRVKSAA